MQAVALKQVHDLALAAAPGYDQHSFLALREHHLVGRKSARAARHLGNVDTDPGSAAPGGFYAGAGEAGRAQVLQTDHRIAGQQLETGLDQQFFHERVAHLDYSAGRLLRVLD